MMLSTGPRLLWSNFGTYWLSINEVWKFKLSSLGAKGSFIHRICSFHGHIHMSTLLLLGNSERDSATSQERCINKCHQITQLSQHTVFSIAHFTVAELYYFRTAACLNELRPSNVCKYLKPKLNTPQLVIVNCSDYNWFAGVYPHIFLTSRTV